MVGAVRRNLGQGPALHQTDLDHSPPGCDGQGGTARPTHQRWGQDRPCSLRGALTGQTLKAGRPRRPPSQASQSLPHTRKEGSLCPRTALLSPVTPRGDRWHHMGWEIQAPQLLMVGRAWEPLGSGQPGAKEGLAAHRGPRPLRVRHWMPAPSVSLAG